MTIEQKEIMLELAGKNKLVDQLEEIKNDKAFISNDIINAIFNNSTLTAFKIMFYIARVSNNKLIGEQYKIKLNRKDLMLYTKISKTSLDENIKKLQKTLVTFYSKKDNEFFTRIQLLGKCHYSEDGINLILNIDKDIYTRLKQTEAEHTEINTIDIMNIIKHKHSIRMLMLLNYIQGFTRVRTKKYTLKQLNYMFDTNYKNYTEFERKILKLVQKELDNNSSLTFDYIKVVDNNIKNIKGRKPIEAIRLIPKKRLLQTNIFSNFDTGTIETTISQNQQIEQKSNIDIFKLTKIIIDDLLVECGIAQQMNEELNRKFELRLYEILESFKKWVKENNKQFLNLEYSFKKYVKDGLNNGYWII